MLRKILVLVAMVLCTNFQLTIASWVERPIYEIFKNDTQRDHLIGCVKSTITEFTDLSKCKRLNGMDWDTKLEKYFSESGNYLIYRLYDDSNKPRAEMKYFYNEFGKLQKVEGGSTTTYLEYDDFVNTVKSARISENDTTCVISKYDSLGTIIKETTVSKSSERIHDYTDSIAFVNSYNIFGCLIRRQLLQDYLGEKQKLIEEYKYDDNGFLFEYTNYCWNEAHKTVRQIDSLNKIIKLTDYIGERIVGWIEGDLNFNVLTRIEFNDKSERIEKKYEYIFDKIGNWIQKKVYIIDEADNGCKELVRIENRKIEYYK